MATPIAPNATIAPAVDAEAQAIDAPLSVAAAFLVLGVRDDAAEIDRRINQAATADWPIERMPRIDRNLARIAIYEIDHTTIDARAAISEALELADALSTDESVAFLNGLLGRAVRTRPVKEPE